MVLCFVCFRIGACVVLEMDGWGEKRMDVEKWGRTGPGRGGRITVGLVVKSKGKKGVW